MKYETYIQSKGWKAKKANWWLLGFPPFCYVCRAERHVGMHMHHRKYTKRGQEGPFDLVPVCEECHALIHRIEGRYPPLPKAKRIPLWEATEKARKQRHPNPDETWEPSDKTAMKAFVKPVKKTAKPDYKECLTCKRQILPKNSRLKSCAPCRKKAKKAASTKKAAKKNKCSQCQNDAPLGFTECRKHRKCVKCQHRRVAQRGLLCHACDSSVGSEIDVAQVEEEVYQQFLIAMENDRM